MNRLLMSAAIAMSVVWAGPSAIAQPLATPWDPSSPPARLTDFAANVNRSMVTIYCAGSLGSGWSAAVALSDEAKQSGYRSYLITNFHVVRDCAYANNRYIEIQQSGIKYPAYIWSIDSNNDLAGVMTTAKLPQLEWVDVPRPLPGQWVAAFGSPYGLAGSITTGIVSYVGENTLTSSAAINPGNSGGPLIDNMGRVLGVNTATVEGSSGFGIVKGTPLLCASVFGCKTSDVWTEPSNGTLGLKGVRHGRLVYLTISQEGLSGELVTLYLKRDGDADFSAYKTIKAPPAGGTSTTILSEPGAVAAYAAAGSVRSEEISISPEQVALTALTGLTATAKGNGVVELSWEAPSWASQVAVPWYQYRLDSHPWIATFATKVTVPGLIPGKTARFTVRGVDGNPNQGGSSGPSASVSVRVR